MRLRIDRGEFRIGELRAGSYLLDVGGRLTASVDVRAGLEGRVDILLAQSLTVTESVFVAPAEIKPRTNDGL